MFGKSKSKVILLGSETKIKDGILHLLKDGDVGGYVVWYQPYETWQGKKYPSYQNWRRLKRGTLGECRKFIKDYVTKRSK